MDNLIATIPHLSKDDKVVKLTFDYKNLFFFILVIVSLMILLSLLVKIFRLNPKNWKVFDVLLCVLGSSMIGNTKRDKLSYLVLILLSFYFCNDVVDLATKFEFNEASKVVEDHVDSQRLKVRIYSPLQPFATFAAEYKDLIRNTTFTTKSMNLTQLP